MDMQQGVYFFSLKYLTSFYLPHFLWHITLIYSFHYCIFILFFFCLTFYHIYFLDFIYLTGMRQQPGTSHLLQCFISPHKHTYTHTQTCACLLTHFSYSYYITPSSVLYTLPSTTHLNLQKFYSVCDSSHVTLFCLPERGPCLTPEQSTNGMPQADSPSTNQLLVARSELYPVREFLHVRDRI